MSHYFLKIRDHELQSLEFRHYILVACSRNESARTPFTLDRAHDMSI